MGADRVLSRMLHPATELRPVNRRMGSGVFATDLIPAGSLVWVRDALDRVLPRSWVQNLGGRYAHIFDHYTYRNAAGDYVLCWDFTKMMNHSCTPNCAGSEFDFEISLRDIHPGEELTNDYALLNLHDHETFPCGCGAAHCRGVIDNRQYPASAAAVRIALARVVPRIGRIPQPLDRLLVPGQIERCQEWLGRPPLGSSIDSIPAP